jgi:hypothetical protein
MKKETIRGVLVKYPSKKHGWFSRLFGFTPHEVYDVYVVSIGQNKYKVHFAYMKKRLNGYSYHDEVVGEQMCRIYDSTMNSIDDHKVFSGSGAQTKAINTALGLLKYYGLVKNND